MKIVDTSLWINFFNSKKEYPQELFSADDTVMCPPIMQEILQGIKLGPVFFELKEILSNFSIVPEHIHVNTYLHASEIYSLGRSKGLTIRSSVDCLIAAIAIENKLLLLHNDQDFCHISKYTSLIEKLYS